MSKFDPKNRQAVQDYLAGLAQFISRLKSRAFLRRFVKLLSVDGLMMFHANYGD